MSERSSNLERAKSLECPKHILVVDDDKAIREIAVFALSHSGFAAGAVANDRQLWEELAKGLPDLLVVDVMMPGRNGYQICQLLRREERSRALPIIVMTAHDEGIYARLSADVGALHHLTKPFHPLELVELCRDVLEVGA